jgi:hypothetical protein
MDEQVKVRAKFRCTSKNIRTSAGPFGMATPVDTEEVHLEAVQGEENKEWSKWTPCGQLSMTINNPGALDAFEVGKDYYLDFTQVKQDAAG